MESKAQKLSESFDRSNTIYEYINSLKEQIESLENDRNAASVEQQSVSYQNLEVIMKYFDEYVEDNVHKQRQYASDQADYQYSLIARYQNELVIAYNKFSSWFIRKSQPDKIVSSSKPRIYSKENDVHINSGHFIIDCSGKGKIFFAIISFIIFGPAFLAFLAGKTVMKIVGIFLNNETSFLDYLFGFACGIVGLYYWLAFLDKVFSDYIWIKYILMFLGACVLLFIIIQYVVAHSSFRADADKYYAIFYPDEYKDACFNRIMEEYNHSTLQSWDRERNLIPSGGHGPLIDHIISELKMKHDKAYYDYSEASNKIAQLENEVSEYNQMLDDVSQEIDQLSGQARQPITDASYNNCVLTNYVALRIQHEDDNLGVLTHDLHPCLCVYDDEKYEDSNALQLTVANIVLELFYGFINENYHGIIDFNLIDFETGGALLSRLEETHKLIDNGIINVCRDDAGRKRLLEKIIKQRSLITDSGGLGDISKQNPYRLANGDEPLPYIIVIHFGRASWNISTEELQLYNGGDKFGFIPIFVMSQKEYDENMRNSNNGIQSLLNDCHIVPMDWF